MCTLNIVLPQIALSTLLTATGEIACEPESRIPYRLRIIGGDETNDVLMIVLDDLERVFESEEDILSTFTLKMCLNRYIYFHLHQINAIFN